MNIVLYKTTSEKIRLSKALGQSKTIQGKLKDNFDILNPVVTLSYSNDILGYNYAFIPDLNRYYYIEGMSINNQTIEITMHVDVLMSHANDIKSSKGTITRGNKGSKYLSDPRIKNTAQHTITHRKLGAGFTKKDEYVVTIAGRSVE